MYCAYITKIENMRKHTNADRLMVGYCFSNAVIVSNDVQENDLGIFFPTDGQIGLEFATANNLLRSLGGYLDDNKRNIIALKLRGERSEGLFMPISALANFTDVTKLSAGDKITTLNGVEICRKYIPVDKSAVQTTSAKKRKKHPEERVKYPFFDEHIDTQQLAYNLSEFRNNDRVYVTEKLHGTSQRTAYTYKDVISTRWGWLRRLFRLPPVVHKETGYVTGSRRKTLTPNHQGFYGDELFRTEAAKLFDGKLNLGEEVFYEIVGYAETGKPLMGTYQTEKTNDKDFVKKYGKQIEFNYGCEPGQCAVYVYRMTMTNPEGYVVEYPTELVMERCKQMNVNFVPVITDGTIIIDVETMEPQVDTPFDFDSLTTVAKKLSNDIEDQRLAPSRLCASHPCEGIVIRIDNREKFTAFKYKNFIFKVLEGLAKASAAAPDIEEAQEVEMEG